MLIVKISGNKMKKVINKIREISKIEDELASSGAGVLAFHSSGEKIVQISTTFLYHHKNIYAVIEDSEDIFDSIIYDINASFTVLKSEKINSKNSSEYKPYYRIFSASLSGILKKPEETKVTDEIRELYSIKYSGVKPGVDEENQVHFLMLDTVEISAFEEIGE
jgi:hypothetical protein